MGKGKEKAAVVLDVPPRKFIEVPVGELADHPMNDNAMVPGLFIKLQENIKANNGVMPAIIVRELTEESKWWHEGGPKYQILDGHQRTAAMKQLGITTVSIDVWPGIDDAKSLLLLATLNSLHGASIPAKRAELLSEFMVMHTDLEADMLLVESPEEIELFQKLLLPDNRESEQMKEALAEAVAEPEDEPVTLEFSVYPAQKKIIDLALEEIAKQMEGSNKRGRAIEVIAVEYLAGTRMVAEHFKTVRSGE